ncbi:glutamyl-tRNA reductase 1, chloroplastic [Amborella trichopoda]|uniref:glutamyl-tRNA reductase n=1 Tax=Amborella trichopoda TaxID=13333 RepID=W1NVL0_AMBTC|nr:glutamyl-tRNA reductase 1, chloroplastic [Amborella trichopoda]ERM98694.1 hypothetical protein AMTR_s00109p00136240 [Amborella trichopoda]|eukprot:XP_006833416.1 glutamyl-tRNA reductase 1, chloroplastic [Amborella trichopoda]
MAGKRARSATNLTVGSISVSSAAVDLAISNLNLNLNPKLNPLKIVVIGAGKMAKLLINHLSSKGFKRVVVVNRTEDRVSDLKKSLKSEIEILYRPFSEIYSVVDEADVIFTCTSSEKPMFLRENLEGFAEKREKEGDCAEKKEKLMFVDISVPRNVGQCVAGVEGVRVFDVDDVREMVETNVEARERKAIEAMEIIEEEAMKFGAWRNSLFFVPTIKKLMEFAESIRVSELERCYGKMRSGVSHRERKAMEELSKGVVKKLLHEPLKHLRCNNGDENSLKMALRNVGVLEQMFGFKREDFFEGGGGEEATESC